MPGWFDFNLVAASGSVDTCQKGNIFLLPLMCKKESIVDFSLLRENHDDTVVVQSIDLKFNVFSGVSRLELLSDPIFLLM